MSPFALARRDQNARKISVINSANLTPQMMPHPLSIKLRIMRDLGLLIRRKQITQRLKIGIRSQSLSCFRYLPFLTTDH